MNKDVKIESYDGDLIITIRKAINYQMADVEYTIDLEKLVELGIATENTSWG